MTQLENNIQKYYTQGYNCSETLLRACNETYQLEINEEDLRCIAALSKMVCPTKAHDMIPTLRPLIVQLNQNFKAQLGALDCAHVKPVYHDKEKGCLITCLRAGKAFEKTLIDAKIGSEN